MDVRTAKFAGSFRSLSQMPTPRLPEVAFIGRSNVGKSSLINMLLGNRKLAKTSGTPGKTRSINLFNINEQIYFVDLPGYGYAKVSKSERGIWEKMIEGYLLKSDHLRVLVQLIDARHGILANDREMLEWATFHQLPLAVVFTKADKLKKNDLAKLQRSFLKPGGEMEGAIACSAQTKLGIKSVWNVIDQVIK